MHKIRSQSIKGVSHLLRGFLFLSSSALQNSDWEVSCHLLFYMNIMMVEACMHTASRIKIGGLPTHMLVYI
jgi:hypothetical protein